MSNGNDMHPYNQSEPEETFNSKAFAKRIGVSPRTLYTYRKDGLMGFSQARKGAPVIYTLQDEINYKNRIHKNT